MHPFDAMQEPCEETLRLRHEMAFVHCRVSDGSEIWRRKARGTLN